MKAITEKQPWASLIVMGIKPIENRTWPCPKKYIGQRVLIHAAATPWGNLKNNSCFSHILTREQYSELLKIGLENFGNSKDQICWLDKYPFGAIIGSVEIVDCVKNHQSIWAEKETHIDKFFGKPIYNWVLANPIMFEKPIPAKGKLSFWDCPNIIAEPEEKDGELFCHCQIPVKEENQVMSLGGGHFMCRYCGGKWYK